MQRTLTVTGHGTAKAVPDSAVVRVGATHRARTVAEAVAGVDRAVATAGEVARGHAARAGIASTGLQVWPVQDHEGRPDGFEATHQLRIACPNLPAASALVVGLAEEVGDQLRIEGVQLEVSDPAPARQRAREAAYDDALARATHLAGLAHGRLGDVLVVTESGAEPGGGPPPGAMLARAGFEPGETTVAAAVTVTWQLT